MRPEASVVLRYTQETDRHESDNDEDSVVVKFQGTNYLEAYTGSTLLAQGSGTYPITFTSASATPAAGSWANIWINDGAQLRMDHVEIAYAGSGWNRALHIEADGFGPAPSEIFRLCLPETAVSSVTATEFTPASAPTAAPRSDSPRA